MSTLVISLLIGQLASFVLWQVLQLFARVPAGSTRHERDLPAVGFRAVRLLIRSVVYYGHRWMPRSTLKSIATRLRSGGVEYSIEPSEFLATKWLSLLIFAGMAGWLIPLLGQEALLLVFIASVLGWRYPDVWLRRRIQRRQSQILDTLPFYLDVITLSLESGSNLTSGLKQAVTRTSESALRQEISRVLREIRAGKVRTEALREFADRTAIPVVVHIISGLVQAERSGASLAPMLRAQAVQLRSQRFQRAEKRAMEAPVKLLGPLFLFIFPSTFVVLGFLIVSKAINGGVLTWAPIVWAYHWPGVKG